MAKTDSSPYHMWSLWGAGVLTVMNPSGRIGVPAIGESESWLSGSDWCKTSGIYVFRSVTGRALNPNNGR